MLSLAHRILLCLPPETAHAIGAVGLKLLQWFRFRILGGTCPAAGSPVILASAPSLKFSGRLGLAAGFDKNAELFAGLSTLGFSFIEVGTVTPLPQDGNPKPRLFRKGDGLLLNHMGFNNCGLQAFRENIVRYRARLPGFPILGNVGKNKATPDEEAVSDYRKGMETLRDVVDGFVCNLSSPNTPGLVKLQTTAFLESLEKAAPEGMPVLVKFSPDLDTATLEDLLRFIADSRRLSGAVVTNTSRVLAEKMWRAPQGGLSGPLLKERSLECVALARKHLKAKIVIGVGGVSSAEDARAFRSAGADLVEIYSSFVYQGPRLAREIAAAIRT